MSRADADPEKLNATDRALLEEMADGRRHTAPELSDALASSRTYVNNRLRHLAQHGYAHAVQHSRGMYEITTKGVQEVIDE